ncbi:maleylacetate reductase [Agromyces bauzanensis]
MTLTFDHSALAQRVIFRTGGAVEGVIDALKSLDAKRVLLINDAFAADLADRLMSRLPVVAREDDVRQHVPLEVGLRVADVANHSAADAVVSVGGGSTTGLAKIVARERGLPIVAVPTTFAGSEATPVWGQTERGRKTTGNDPGVLPRVVVYDAELTRGMPAELVVASGLNALAHAVDGLWAPRADPINRALSTEGMDALVPALRAIVAAPDDLDAREQALYGAYLCAVGFATAGSGLHHKICHSLGGAHALPHAPTHAVVLPYVVAFNAPAARDAAERIARIFGAGEPGGLLRHFALDLGAPRSLADLGMPEEGIADVVDQVLPVVPPSNPRPVAREDLAGIVRAAWCGREFA